MYVCSYVMVYGPIKYLCSCSKRTLQKYYSPITVILLPINRGIWPVNCAIHRTNSLSLPSSLFLPLSIPLPLSLATLAVPVAVPALRCVCA